MAIQDECHSIGNPSGELKTVKILILGDVDIGKTTLIKTSIAGVQTIHKDLGIFEMHRVRMRYKGNEARVGLIDLYPGTNSPERRESYPTDVNAILLCFSIGHYETLMCVHNLWIHEVRAHYGKNMPIFLVGLRSDARFVPAPPHAEHQDRLVEKSEAENIHKTHHFYGDYMECSMNDRNSVVRVVKTAFIAALGY